MVAIVSVGFVSCGDDDDDNNDNNKEEQSSASIIGTWRNDWGSGARSYTAYSFFATFLLDIKYITILANRIIYKRFENY